MATLTGLKHTLTIALAVLSLVCCGTSHKAAKEEQQTETKQAGLYSPNTLIIMYDSEVGKEPIVKAIKRYGAEVIYDYNIIPGMAIRIPDGKDIRDAAVYFRKVKGVLSVERDAIYETTDSED